MQLNYHKSIVEMLKYSLTINTISYEPKCRSENFQLTGILLDNVNTKPSMNLMEWVRILK